MDYLDPKKQLRQKVLLITGYVLIGFGIIIATTVLLYQAYGFGFGKNGTVIQNGLLFFSSQPNPANITINGKLSKYKTNSRLELPSGTYNVKLTKAGYRPWQRTIAVEGGSVEHFDYPMLFPTNLITKKLATYASSPGLVTQSPNRNFLLVQRLDVNDSFDLYDMTNPTKAPTQVTLPPSVASKATTSESWQLIAWADDNQHVLLQHTFDGKTEDVLVDTNDPTQSVNLTQMLTGDTYTQITLDNEKYDQYYLYNAADNSLDTASLKTPAAVPLLSNVLSYQTYGNNTVLYVTSDGAPSGKVEAKEQVGDQSYSLGALDANTTYLLDLTEYSGTPYVAVGAASENKVLIYDNPVGQLNNLPNHAPVPVQVLHVIDPTYVSFSTNAQFIMAEGAQQFGVYDIENADGYNYTTKLPLDAPQTHAVWMDGDRLTYVSGGKLVVFDYDHRNVQTLMPANPAYLPVYAPNYDFIYTLAPVKSATNPAAAALTQTSLFIPADQ